MAVEQSGPLPTDKIGCFREPEENSSESLCHRPHCGQFYSGHEEKPQLFQAVKPMMTY